MKYLTMFLFAFILFGCSKDIEKTYNSEKPACESDNCNIRFRLEKYICGLLAETKLGKISWKSGIFEDNFYIEINNVRVYITSSFISFHFPASDKYKDFYVQISNQCSKDLQDFVYKESLKLKSKAIEDQVVDGFLNEVSK